MSEHPYALEALLRDYREIPFEPSGLAIALAEAGQGNFVFPTEPYAKTPWHQSNGYPLRWSEVATADLTEITELGWPEGAGVAIACKPSGLLIIDTDQHEHDGVKAFIQLCEQNEPDGDYPDTYIVETPTGGLHHYYWNPDPERFGNGTGSLPAGIDVRGGRGDGGYVLAAGSVLDRRAYADKDPELQALVGDGKPYTIYNNAPVIKPPGWLLAELSQKPRRKRTSGEACHALLREWPSVTLARLNAELSKVARAQNGGRNNELFEAACRFGEAVAVGRLDEETARRELEGAAHQMLCTMDSYEIETAISSGLAKGAADLIGGK